MFCLAASILFFSCETEEDGLAIEFTEADAAETIEIALSESEGGFATEVTTLSQEVKTNYDTISINCNYLNADSAVSSYNGPRRTFNFVLSSLSQVSCNNLNVPTGVEFSMIRNGSYTGPRLSHQGSGTSSLTLSNLNPLSGSDYSISGQHTYTGSQTLTTLAQARTLDTQMTFTITDISVDKTTLLITGGQASFTLVAVNGAGETLAFQGSITFLGSGQADVTINGETYPISI